MSGDRLSHAPPSRLSEAERTALRPDIDLDAFERLLAVLPAAARPLFLRLAAARPDLLAIWEAAPALRAEERGERDEAHGYDVPRLQVYVVPKLEDVSLSQPALQEMLRAVFRKAPA